MLNLPKFLTKEVAEIAVDTVMQAVFFGSLADKLNRPTCHVVIVVPTQGSANEIIPYVLYEKTHGEREGWGEHHFNHIATSKSFQLWYDRHDGGTCAVPHLLMPGDTPYWGGVKREGIVVACSGVQPYFDRMISGMVADACIALAADAYSKWLARTKSTIDFLE